MSKLNYTYLLVLLFFPIGINAQNTFFNQADVYVDSTAEVHVFGNFVTDGSLSSLDNKGLIQTYNDANNGDFELRNLGVVNATGNFKIENDWINDGQLLITAGTTEMYGAAQNFDGDSISSFWNLTLTGTNIKHQLQSIRVQDSLLLNDRELAVHATNLFLDFEDANAIQYLPTFGQEGYISTDEDGIIHKVHLVNAQNFIPTGSTVAGIRRFRPLIFQRTSGAMTDTSYITFHHHSPDNVLAFAQDLDTSLCKIQDRYFYTFNAATLADAYNLSLASYAPEDGYYPTIAQWESLLWKYIPNNSTTTIGNYDYVTAIGEQDFLLDHYALAYHTPEKPNIVFDSTECNVIANYSIANPNSDHWYQWNPVNVNNSAFLETPEGLPTATINWGDHIGEWVYCNYVDTAGCTSYMDTAHVIDASVLANFTFQMNYQNDFSTPINFQNTSSSNSTDAHWFIGNDAYTFTDPQNFNPIHYIYNSDGEDAELEVMLIAEDTKYGCIDTAYKVITIPGVFAFYVPNSFTPNEDGINDFFFGYADHATNVQLQIFNRWGELIFEGSNAKADEIRWDGKYKGSYVPTGAYTYKFHVQPYIMVENSIATFEYVGTVSVLR